MQWRSSSVPALLVAATLTIPTAVFADPGPSVDAVWVVQQGTLTGRVLDAASQQPLRGAAVQVVGTGRGAVTDQNGRFSIDGLPAGTHRVRVTMLGYGDTERTATVAAGGSATLDFSLSARAVALEGIVAVGYGTASAQQLPSSVVQVDAEKLKSVATEDVATMLQGKVAGVMVTSGSGRPGDAPQVRIRGTGSILANSEPLYVVDGVISDASIAQSVPADNIASVSVLKDAAATSLYGSRAANGVIVITTQSGRAGKTMLQINASTGTTEALFGNFRLMNSQELYDLERSMNVPGVTEAVLANNTDWLDVAFDQGQTAEVNLAASGGDENTRFFVSGGYYKEDGTLMATGYDRLSGRVNLEHSVNDRFRVTARAYGNYQNRLFNPSPALLDSYVNLPWDNPYLADGTLRSGLEPEWRGRERRNFLYEMQYNWEDGRQQNFGGDVEGEYDLTDWLSLSTKNRVSFEYDRIETYNDLRTPGGSATAGGLRNRHNYGNSILTSNLARFDRDFGDHSLDALGGFEYQKGYSDNIDGTGVGIFPGLGVLSVTSTPRALAGVKNESAFASLLSQVNYGYLDRYFLTGSYRRDGSSRFGADNRWGDFYSVAGAWLLTNESFMQDFSGVHNLKLRASYGTTGNAEIGNYLAQSLYGFNAQYAGVPAAVIVREASPDLTWEVARTLNLGLDVGVFDRVDLSVDLYRRTNTDLLQNVEQPKTSGFNVRTMNVGSVQNQGLELGLSTLNLDGAFSWTTDFNIAFNRNKVLALFDDKPILRGEQRIIEGRDINTWFQRKWAGVDPQTGDPLWEKLTYGDNGEVVARETTNNYSAATLQVVGSSTPDFTGGMQNVLSWGGLTLNTFVTFVSGNELYHDARFRLDADGAYPTFNSMALRPGWTRWTKPGDVATHPRPVNNGNRLSNRPSSRFLEDGSYLRLQNATLGYQIPESVLGGLRVGSARVYVSGDNLLTLTEFSGMDPEDDTFGTIDTKYPISRKLLVGVQMGL